jgi:hypothetical protein
LILAGQSQLAQPRHIVENGLVLGAIRCHRRRSGFGRCGLEEGRGPRLGVVAHSANVTAMASNFPGLVLDACSVNLTRVPTGSVSMSSITFFM